MENTIKVRYEPIKEIIIHHMRKLSSEKFLQRYATPEDAFLSWADGYLVNADSFDTDINEYLMQERLKGITHLALVDFCKFEKYQEMLKNQRYNHEIQVIDVSKDPLFKELVNLIKQYDEKMVEI